MKSLTLKQIPDELHLALKRRAKANHRSLNGEVIAILENAAEGDNAATAQRTTSSRTLLDALLDSPLRGSGLVLERNTDTGREIDL